jgi:hypothetical protein
MRKELRNGSSDGILLQGLTFGQKAFSVVLASVVTLMLVVLPVVLPNIL